MFHGSEIDSDGLQPCRFIPKKKKNSSEAKQSLAFGENLTYVFFLLIFCPKIATRQ